MSLKKPIFSVITSSTTKEIIKANRPEIVRLVRDAYTLYGKEKAVNPNSIFLRFMHSVDSRIIALPACIYGDFQVAGIKWVSSFPANVAQGIERASAALILNDLKSGYPFACLEASEISANRTAASAILWLGLVCPEKNFKRVGIVGCGVISRTILEYLIELDFDFDSITVYDKDQNRSSQFKHYFPQYYGKDFSISPSIDDLFSTCDVIVLATTASQPHILDPKLFDKNPKILNISLRDIAPEIILASNNVVDDSEHCLQAGTSVHLAEKLSGRIDFITANIYDILIDDINNFDLSPDKPTIFSPFGMGILDLAVGKYIYDMAVWHGKTKEIPDFF